eukprot:CAMPEP_0172321382 /NCGR_PEP_ID=MMETSP1058-20130122/43206_1 /TAXON_ID=83371 /ORGANISM="Detonula confervacea, Strain CCMP 353" /LENGTH=406 /DNA_ID=CAMNT_0013036875 /DNA_START=61 /DNA_END=1281 /DNA_ORIENTATION=-
MGQSSVAAATSNSGIMSNPPSAELQGLTARHDYNSIVPSDDNDSEARLSALEAILYKPRLDALLACDANVISYEPFSFLMVFGLRGRNFGMICAPLCGLLLWDICWALTLETEQTTGLAGVITTSLDGLIAPLLTPVSFLLVFRLGRAAVRFWDSRAAFGKLVEICRVIMSTAAVSCKHNHRQDLCNEFARWICAFPIATKNFLRPNLPCSRDGRSRRREIGPLLSEKEAQDMLTPVNGGGSMEFIAPIHVLDRIRELSYVLSFGDGRSSSSDVDQKVPAPSATAILQTQKGVALYRQLNGQVDTLCGAWGAMERIAATPLPFVYVVHLRTFLLLYLFLWNLQGIGSNGWKSIPALLAASWALLGIEAAAVECERPYQLHSNHLPLGKMCVVVAKNVAQTVKTVGY